MAHALDEARFWDRVDYDVHDVDRCWPWLGKPDAEGYGRFTIWPTGELRRIGAMSHRVAYELVMGEPPAGIIDHTCHDPDVCKLRTRCPHRACQNPHHMSPGTSKDNAARGRRWNHESDKTHCPQGHEYTEDNTYMRPGRRHRSCRECARASCLRWWQANR